MTAPVVTDPIEFELFQNGLRSAADEMALTVLRTARSSIVRDAMDFATGLCDARGRLIAQGLTLPIHLGSIPDAMQATLARFGDDWTEGDVVFLNDPYHGGMHIPDVFMFEPVFVEGELVGYTVATMHQADMGGRVPTSQAADSTEVFQEGVRIPPLKLVKAGQLQEDLLELLLINVRMPDLVRGDLESELGACERGRASLQALVARYGPARFAQLSDTLFDYTERLVRQEFEQFRQGVYEFEDFLDGDGLDDRPLRIAVKLTIADGTAEVDFTGSSPQARGAITPTLSMTKSAVYAALRCVLSGDVPNNEGFFKRVRVRTEEGTIVHARFPAAVAARGVTAFRIMDCMFGALSQAVPERVPAAGDGGVTVFVIAGYHNGRAFQVSEPMSSSWGARPHADGVDGISHPGVNIRNTPVEVVERQNPVTVERFGYVPDSGGAGRYRGGLALIKEWRVLTEEAVLQVRADRQQHLPYGLYGGADGSPSHAEVVAGHSGPATRLRAKVTTNVGEHDLVRLVQAGGGGHGDPLDRPADSVLADVVDGKVTPAGARDGYGVVIDSERGVVDVAATEALRGARRGGARS